MVMGGTLLPIEAHAESAAGPLARQIEGGWVSQRVPLTVRVCLGMVKRSKTGAVAKG